MYYTPHTFLLLLLQLLERLLPRFYLTLPEFDLLFVRLYLPLLFLHPPLKMSPLLLCPNSIELSLCIYLLL